MKEKIIKILQKHIFVDGDIWVIYDLKKMYDDLLPVIDINAEVESRIAERMPTEEEIDKKAYYYAQMPVSDEEGCETEFDGELSNAFAEGCEWFRNRMKKITNENIKTGNPRVY